MLVFSNEWSILKITENRERKGIHMDVSSIPAASTSLSLAETQQCIGFSLLRKTMDYEQVACAELLQSADATLPSLGRFMDVRA